VYPLPVSCKTFVASAVSEPMSLSSGLVFRDVGSLSGAYRFRTLKKPVVGSPGIKAKMLLHISFFDYYTAIPQGYCKLRFLTRIFGKF